MPVWERAGDVVFLVVLVVVVALIVVLISVISYYMNLCVSKLFGIHRIPRECINKTLSGFVVNL